MAGKVFFSVTMSLDGYIAPEERRDDPDVQRWTAQWMELQQWIFPQRFFRENLKLGEGGEVSDGIEPALDQARAAAGDRDVRRSARSRRSG
jgi:hypothetical protein